MAYTWRLYGIPEVYMIGTKILFDNASRTFAEHLAECLETHVPLAQVGTRGLWEYPGENRHEGDPVNVGNFSFTHITVYHDGRGVFLYLGGPNVPRDRYSMGALRDTLGYQTPSRASVDMVSGTQI
ncbi:MAG: hypothetical protein AAGF12_07915 [Myxococcota bacterium]